MRYRKAISFAMVKDGVSNTIMVGETLPRHCRFISAFAVNFNVSSTNVPINHMAVVPPGATSDWWTACGFKSRHPGGAQYLMGDGSVHFLTESIDFRLYNELGTRAGGEVVSLP